MVRFFNVNSIKSAWENVSSVKGEFRYGFIENIFYNDVFEKLAAAFPPVAGFSLVDKPSGGGRKRFYTGPVYDANKTSGCVCHFSKLPGIWQEVVLESASPELVNILRDTTGVDFNTMCTFGFGYGKEGCVQEPHIDGAVRPDRSGIHSTIATLIYLNRQPGSSSGTCVYDLDRKTVLYQVKNMHNSLFFFEQHPNAWHGFPLMPPGEERRLVSLAYSQEPEPIGLKSSFIHKAICQRRYKNLLKNAILGR